MSYLKLFLFQEKSLKNVEIAQFMNNSVIEVRIQRLTTNNVAINHIIQDDAAETLKDIITGSLRWFIFSVH